MLHILERGLGRKNEPPRRRAKHFNFKYDGCIMIYFCL